METMSKLEQELIQRLASLSKCKMVVEESETTKQLRDELAAVNAELDNVKEDTADLIIERDQLKERVERAESELAKVKELEQLDAKPVVYVDNDFATAWQRYKAYLIEKYPAKDGKPWQFTCEHHKRIDELLTKQQPGEVQLEPGWLARQLQEVQEEVAKWPDIVKQLGAINSELTRKAGE